MAKKKTKSGPAEKSLTRAAMAKKKAQSGATLLTAWLSEEEMSIVELAGAVDCCKQTISALKNGTFPPGLALAVRIEKETGIPVAAWVQ